MIHKNLNDVASYCRDVLSGKRVAGKLEKLAVQRHLNDLKKAKTKKYPYYFDEAKALRAINFFHFCRHSKGRWAGEVIELSGWQMFIQASVYGWTNKETGLRRFRTVYEEVARKNGKTTKLAGTGLFGLLKDNEEGAEIYSAATKRDQAKIMHEEAARMVKKSPALRKHVGVFRNNLHVLATSSKFEPLGRDSDTADGFNVHYGLVDEIHAHKTREMWDVLETATGSREQPLMWTITTAGFNKLGIGYELRSYAIKVLEGTVDDDTFFAIIFTIDEGDEWDDESVWAKANPNLGISVSLEDLRRKAKKAKEMPTAMNNFKCKHLNIWTNAETLWMNMEEWKECGGEVYYNKLKGRECYAGLDLATVSDIAALGLVFPPKYPGDKTQFMVRYYLPEDAVKERTEKAHVPYALWAEMGLLTLTPGNITDYNYIKRDIKELSKQFRIQEIAFDRWNSSQLVNDLMDDGANMVPFGQGFASMTAPMKELERLVLSHELNHGNDPILQWMASNLVAKEDEAHNLKPDKKNSQEKIDGIVAILMAIGRILAAQETKRPTIGKDYNLLGV